MLLQSVLTSPGVFGENHPSEFLKAYKCGFASVTGKHFFLIKTVISSLHIYLGSFSVTCMIYTVSTVVRRTLLSKTLMVSFPQVNGSFLPPPKA